MNRYPRIEKAAWLAGAVVGLGSIALAIPVTMVLGPDYSSMTLVVGFSTGSVLIVISAIASGELPTISAKD